MTLSLLSLRKPRRRPIASRSMASPKHFDAPRPKLGESRGDVGDVQAEVVVCLNARLSSSESIVAWGSAVEPPRISIRVPGGRGQWLIFVGPLLLETSGDLEPMHSN